MKHCVECFGRFYAHELDRVGRCPDCRPHRKRLPKGIPVREIARELGKLSPTSEDSKPCPQKLL